MKQWVLLLLCSVVAAQAQQYTFHIYSPWAGDSTLVSNRHHVQGGFSSWSADNASQMTAEGDGWYSFTINQTLVDWWDVTLRNCPVASDQNCNGGLTWSIKPKVVALFGNETEVWVIPDSSAQGYHISLIPPNAKVVWFKSPWGNKIIPKMVSGYDTIAMHYGTDDRCGWFYGALRDSQITDGRVYFIRLHTDQTLPASGTLDLSQTTASADTVFVDGTATSLSATSTPGTTGTCMDTSKVVHILHPWMSDANRSGLGVYLHAGNLLGNYAAMLRDDSLTGRTELYGWYSYSFPGTTTWSQNEALDFRSYDPAPENGAETYPFHPAGKTLFPPGEYEVWLLPEADTVRVLRAPLQVRIINLMNPFENSVPRLLMHGDTLPMRAIADTCGWYRTTLWEDQASWTVTFAIALGNETYGNDGLNDATTIVLDSLLRQGNQAWIKPNPYPSGAAVVAKLYPGPPGDCPARKLAVMVFDQKEDNVDFQNPSTGCSGHWTGMVESKLVNGLPVRASNPVNVDGSGGSCSPRDLEKWFVPQTLSGTYTNATCYDLPLALDQDGFWLADYYESQAKKLAGFFPIDDFQYLDSGRTVSNPNWSQLADCNNLGKHDFHFTMHVNAEFKYVPGQYFEFRGDDDVWVFINDSLVVDIGGVHGPIAGSVDVDSLGLTPGNTYSFNIFFAERNTCGSNFKMRTSMDLHTDRTYYPVQVAANPGIIRYEIYQILKEQTLRCDFSASVTADTVRAPSTFQLYGPMFPDGPVTLSSGANYGGITIDDDFTGFSIDTTAIVRERALAPGRYRLVFSNSVDPSLNEEVYFTVPSYPLPGILFTDSTWTAIDPDTAVLGEWAFVPYPVYVEARYMGVKCPDCNDLLDLATADSLVFLDSLKQRITSIHLDSGRARFWVMGTATVYNGEFRVSGTTVQNELWWKKINLKEPPVPLLRYARMYDRDGNGIGDSLALGYSRPLHGKDAPDSLLWVWGDTTQHVFDSSSIQSAIVHDSLLVFTGDSLAGLLFTGTKDGKPYSGSTLTWFTYTPTEGADSGLQVPFEINSALEDHIAPVVIRAEIGPGDGLDTLHIWLSESLVSDSLKAADLFELSLMRSGENHANQAILLASAIREEGSRYLLYYDNQATVVPTVGDSVRLVPSIAFDLAHNLAHQHNPMVRITGRQRSLVETIGLVTITPDRQPGEDAPVVREVLAQAGQNIKDLVAQEGVPGHLILFDLSNIVESSTTPLKPSDVVLDYTTAYYTNLGQFVNQASGSIGCDDELFQGDCTQHPGNLFIGWNLRSENGRVVGTGAYITQLHFVVRMQGLAVEDRKVDQVWGIRRADQ